MARYEDFPREMWAARRTGSTPAFSSLADPSLSAQVSASDLADVYLPLAELIAHRAAGVRRESAPFFVSVVGSVAVGKSTSASALQALLASAEPGREVDVVSTDGFLYSNRVLAARGLTDRKGFPESYDLDAVARFFDALQRNEVALVPRYSHVVYDVVDETQLVDHPAVVILEGMPLANERVDLSVYLDAAEADIEQWFIARFLALCGAATDDPTSFFRHFAGYSSDQALAFAREVWVTINAVNLHEHILPVRDQCDVILEKGHDHAVRRVRLRESDPVG